LGEALDKCDSAEAFAAVLDMSFQGITTPHSGYLPQEEVFDIAKDILKSAKSEDAFDKMIAIPKTCYDENSEAWRVWLASPDYSHRAFMRFLRDGRLLEFYRYASPSRYVD
jgi:hypothetical protein